MEREIKDSKSGWMFRTSKGRTTIKFCFFSKNTRIERSFVLPILLYVLFLIISFCYCWVPVNDDRLGMVSISNGGCQGNEPETRKRKEIRNVQKIKKKKKENMWARREKDDRRKWRSLMIIRRKWTGQKRQQQQSTIHPGIPEEKKKYLMKVKMATNIRGSHASFSFYYDGHRIIILFLNIFIDYYQVSKARCPTAASLY